MLFLIVEVIILILCLLLSVMFFTLLERKVMASIHRRKGPNVVGYLGLLQALADGLKLIIKEVIIPSTANKFLFILAPLFTFILSLIVWVVIPFDYGVNIVNININLIYVLVILSLNVYGIIVSGWASNSKYAFLGSLRSSAQMISYEISMVFIILTVILCAQSYNLSLIVQSQANIWYFIPLFPVFILFTVCMLAETNRHPFDLPEAESELVSGYNVEYSSVTFALFFLGEYGYIILMSALCSILFLGGWLPAISFLPISNKIWFAMKTVMFMIFFVVVRAILPRYRYDQLMNIGWRVILPFSLGFFLLTVGLLIYFNLTMVA